MRIASVSLVFHRIQCSRDTLLTFVIIRSAAVLIGLLLRAALAPTLWAEPPSAPKRILVLFPFDSARPSTSEILKGLEDGLLNSYGSRVTVFVEFIRPTPPVRAGFHEGLLEWFSYKYGAQTFDAICPLRPEAVTLAEQLRKRLWPSTPIVFAMLKDEYQPGFGPNASATGVVWELADRQAIRAALRLLPETRHIALVGGSGAGDVDANRRLSGLIRQTVPGIDLIPLTGASLAEVESRVGSLPEKTILYQGWFDEDAKGRNFTWAEVASLLSPKANRPMFSSVDLTFGSGVVGGPMASVRHGGEDWGRQVGRVLAGTSPASLPLSTGYDVKAVDWRQLKRWHIPENRVPAGTEIRFRESSPWEEHRALILSVTAAILLQALAIGFLLVERRRRSVSERAATERARNSAGRSWRPSAAASPYSIRTARLSGLARTGTPRGKARKIVSRTPPPGPITWTPAGRMETGSTERRMSPGLRSRCSRGGHGRRLPNIVSGSVNGTGGWKPG